MQASWRYRFPVSRERLWPFVSDTDRINRGAGLPPVTYRTERDAAGGAHTIATARRGPRRVSWEEPPFTWEVPHRLAITRRFLGGPFAVFESEVLLEADGEATNLEHRVDLTPRNALGRALAPVVLALGARGAARAYAAAARAAADGETRPLVPMAARDEARLEERFVRAVEAERALDGRSAQLRALVRDLATYIETSDERDLGRIRPYAVADLFAGERRSVLALMLGLTRAGLLDLSWDVICNSCRRPQQFEKLEDVSANVHCPTCNITYGPQLDRNVEVTFSAAPLGKGVDVPVFCAVGPHQNRQVYGQKLLEPGEAATFDVALAPGPYAVEVAPDRAVQFAASADGDPGDLRVEVAPGELRVSRAAVRAGSLHVAVANAQPGPALVKVTEGELPPEIATAADVTALQEFRDLFSSEVLASGLDLAIRSLTIVFSDLVGSTSLYSRHGDAPAFRLVRDHFDSLRSLIAAYDGAIVKTIGDAVMAVFTDPGNAFDAAVRFAPSVGIVMGPAGPLEIRVGMNTGPCIAMRANDRLDYFGTTVNLAARVQHVAGAGEVALSRATAEQAAIATRLRGREQRIESIPFKGIAEPVAVVKIAADASV